VGKENLLFIGSASLPLGNFTAESDVQTCQHDGFDDNRGSRWVAAAILFWGRR